MIRFTEANLGFGEIIRMAIMVLSALNIGTLSGRVRRHLKVISRLAKYEDAYAEDIASLRSIARFYVGLLIIFASTIWRVVQLYHAPFAWPLALVVLGLLLSLLGLRGMMRHVTPLLLTRDAVDALENTSRPPRRRPGPR